MKKSILGFLFIVICAFCTFAEETVQRKFYLKGEAQGIEISIDLSNFLDSNFWKITSGEIKAQNISDLKVLMEPFHVIVKNKSDKTINMNWVYDSFIVAVERKEEMQQIEYNLLDIKDTYPKKILKGAKVSFSIPSKLNTAEKLMMWISRIEPYHEDGVNTGRYCYYINEWNEDIKEKEVNGTLSADFYKPLNDENKKKFGQSFGKHFSATFTLGIENIKEIEINLVPYLEITNEKN